MCQECSKFSTWINSFHCHNNSIKETSLFSPFTYKDTEAQMELAGSEFVPRKPGSDPVLLTTTCMNITDFEISAL